MRNKNKNKNVKIHTRRAILCCLLDCYIDRLLYILCPLLCNLKFWTILDYCFVDEKKNLFFVVVVVWLKQNDLAHSSHNFDIITKHREPVIAGQVLRIVYSGLFVFDDKKTELNFSNVGARKQKNKNEDDESLMQFFYWYTT